MSRKKINYQHIFNKYSPISHGWDTTVQKTKPLFEDSNLLQTVEYIKGLIAKNTINTSDHYHHIDHLQQMIHSYKMYKHLYTINTTYSSDQFTAPLVSQAYNRTTQKITKYSGFFQLQRLGQIQNKITNQIYKNTIEFIPCHKHYIRTDYFYDFPCTPDDIISLLEQKQEPIYNRNTQVYFSNNGRKEIETFYIGSKSSKSVLVRIYNKKLDSKNKQKSHLYPYYNNHSHITRMEFELGTKFCEEYSLKEIKNKLENYMGLKHSRKGPFTPKQYQSHNTIVNIDDYSQKWIKQTCKLSNNHVDRKKIIDELNQNEIKNYRRSPDPL